MKHSLRQALERAAFVDPRKPRVESVRLPVRETADRAVRRRLVGETAVTLAPVSIAAPAEDTESDLLDFAIEQLRPSGQRLARSVFNVGRPQRTG